MVDVAGTGAAALIGLRDLVALGAAVALVGLRDRVFLGAVVAEVVAFTGLRDREALDVLAARALLAADSAACAALMASV